MVLPSTKELELMALVESEELSGREVAKRYEKETNKRISYGTLYTTFRRLKESGWVEARESSDDDGRVRYFRLTGAGIRVLRDARRHHTRLAHFGLPERGGAT
jgi:DNA-binding PadR family transcriptional regulator